jgi:ABC-type sugar transport system substrate-binding protein
MNIRRMGIVLALLVGLVAAGCGDDDDDGGGEGGASQDQLASYQPDDKTVRRVDEDTFKVGKPAREYVIGVSFPHFKDPYWIAEAYGVEQEAKRLGVEARINAASGYGDTTGQLRQIDTYLTQQVDALLLGAVDSKAMAPAADRAWNEGIPVIYTNALAESERSIGVYTDDELAGTKQADYIASKDPNAQVIAMCGPPGVVWPKKRCEAFVDRLEEKAPDSKVLAMKYHDMDRAKIAEVAGNTLEGFPEATWVYNSTDLQAKGVIDALRARGDDPGEVKITNLTIGEELYDYMKEGWITYALSERAVTQGRLAVDMAVMILNGEKPPANWAVDLPGYEGDQAGIAQFEEDGEAPRNWAPQGYRP